MAKDIEEVLRWFEGVAKVGNDYKALCPCHDDHNQSLTISHRGSKVLIYCHAGCRTENVLAVVGAGFSDLRLTGTEVAHYDYRDEKGQLLYQVVRYEPKDFRQRAPDGKGGWTWKVKGIRKVPYRLRQLLLAKKNKPVLVVEGEKDVDKLHRIGVVATCNAGGAGKWTEDLSNFLIDRDVVVVPDNDDRGRSHAVDVMSKLSGIAKSVQIVELPGTPEKGDVSDWLAAGGNKSTLMRLVKHGKSSDSPTPLGVLCGLHPTMRSIVVEGIAREGETVNIIAPPKVGKSWLAWSLALSIANGVKWLQKFEVTKGQVLVVDNELHPETIASRAEEVCQAMGLDGGNIEVMTLRGKRVDYNKLATKMRLYGPKKYKAVVIDSHYRMLPTGTDENDNSHIKDVYNLIDEIADFSRAAWFLIHHSSKGDQSDKGVTDVGSGAGSQARAADTHLILRKHADDGAYVLEAAVRSFKPLRPLTLRWDFPVWKRDDDLDPRQLENRETKEQKRRDEDGKKKVLNLLKRSRNPMTTNEIVGKIDVGAKRAQRLINLLRNEGKIKSVTVIKSGNKSMAYVASS